MAPPHDKWAAIQIRGESMDNVSLLKNLYDAFGRGDIPTVLGTMSPDIHWYEAESTLHA